MRQSVRTWIWLAAVAMAPAVAQAGWVAQFSNTPLKKDGARGSSETSSMEIAAGRVRLSQPLIVTLVDYNTGTFTLMNPTKEYFWSGTVDEYVSEMLRTRNQNFQRQGFKMKPDKGEAGGDGESRRAPEPDPKKLPPISIVNTGLTEKIAGFDATKYEVRADGELFQELWIAPSLDVSADLNFDRYLTEQRKLSSAMLGKSAGPYNALYADPQFRQLTAKSIPLKLVTHHMSGGFERVAVSFQPAEIPAAQFEIPDSYRRVRLSDVLPPPPPDPKQRREDG